jgi:hypothetical protein
MNHLTGINASEDYIHKIKNLKEETSRSQWPCGLRRGSAAARLLGLWVRIPPRAWMSVCCECCVLSGRGLWGRAAHSSRGVLPSVVCLKCVWSWSLEKWGGLGPQGAVEPLKKKRGNYRTAKLIFTLIKTLVCCVQMLRGWFQPHVFTPRLNLLRF